MKETDYLIIGSGVAGLSLAIKIATALPNKKITLVTKSNEDESNTKYAQGGIAIVQNKMDDDFEKHIHDTLICGDGLCDKDVVSMVVTEGPLRLKELIQWGATFDINEKGTLDLGREGGHSTNRVVHHKDQTGQEIERTLLTQAYQKNNIKILNFHFALELLHKNNTCFGAYVLNEKTNEVTALTALYTILATGGIGQLYGHTTNPSIATGDGIAMAKRAKATITEMEFIQFHPTALFSEERTTTFLISEAVRGFGAYLRNKSGVRFMFSYDMRGELASRDIISQCIEKELKKTGESCVYLDCTHLDMNAFIKHFPMIYNTCKTIGIELEQDWIPVVPAQHYLCGGISVDQYGRTSITNLFACGECSRTGLHGANRLASNSLLEALVYSDHIYHFLLNKQSFKQESKPIFPIWSLSQKDLISSTDLEKIRLELQQLMQQKVGIVRNNSDLLIAKKQLLNWKESCLVIQQNKNINKPYYELKNMIDIGLLIVEQSLLRNENRGSFVKS